MIIDRFGDEYETAYPLPQGAFSDEWASIRPPVTARVGGMSGVVDFFGTEAYPLGPLIVKKKMMLVGSSWEDVGTKIDDLMDSTIMAEFESKLWGLQRDGTTTMWCYAKCTSLTIEERATNPTTGVPVSIEFFCREGIWYGGAENESTYSTTGTKTITNAGASSAKVRFQFYNAPGAATVTEISITNSTTGDTWTFSGDVLADTILVVDAIQQSCLNAGAAAYADLAVGSGQTDWLALAVGDNSVTISITPNTGTFQYGFYWLDSYP